MPLLRNLNQPFFPDPNSPNRYGCSGEYCYPITLGDRIRHQWYQTPCGNNEISDPDFTALSLGTELITNGSFATATDWLVDDINPLPDQGWAYGTAECVHTAGAGNGGSLTQSSIGLTAGNYYRITITVTLSSGGIYVELGDAVSGTITSSISESGTYTYDLYFNDPFNDIILIVPEDDTFDGSVTGISVKEITYTDWNGNGDWQFDGGYACHSGGGTDSLEEIVANYIDADEYYQLTFTVTGMTAGTVTPYISDVSGDAITANGTYTIYKTPTIAGVVSFVPSADFNGCISAPDLRKLRNDYQATILNDDGDEYDVSYEFDYYNQYVTMNLDISTLEVPYGCYTLEVTDTCLTLGNDLVTNGDFADGSTGWYPNNGGGQYAFGSGYCELIFEPLEGATLITNGDFSAGSTGWTGFGAGGWSISGGAALHTPGTAGSISQTVSTSPPVSPPLTLLHWYQFTISGWTQGSVTVTLSNVTSGVSWGMNDTITGSLRPTIGGSVTFSINATSDFDGTIDDIALHESTNIWSASPILFNEVNTDMVAGAYQLNYDITNVTGSYGNIEVAMRLGGMTQSSTWEGTIGSHQVNVTNYVPGTQRVVFIARFGVTDNVYPGRIRIDNVEAVRTEPFEATYISECLNYQLTHERTKLINAYCDQDAFGFEFTNSGFRLQQRIICRSIAPVYPTSANVSEYGTGDAAVGYAEVSKYWQLHTDMMSESAHDCLAIQQRCDHFLIGDNPSGTEYIAQVEDYTPNWNTSGSYDLASSVITLRTKENGQVFNRHV